MDNQTITRPLDIQPFLDKLAAELAAMSDEEYLIFIEDLFLPEEETFMTRCGEILHVNIDDDFVV